MMPVDSRTSVLSEVLERQLNFVIVHRSAHCTQVNKQLPIVQSKAYTQEAFPIDNMKQYLVLYLGRWKK